MTCPCLLADQPCHRNCTCRNALLSGGCKCCATYGSPEQQRAKANHIVSVVKNWDLVKRRLDEK